MVLALAGFGRHSAAPAHAPEDRSASGCGVSCKCGVRQAGGASRGPGEWGWDWCRLEFGHTYSMCIIATSRIVNIYINIWQTFLFKNDLHCIQSTHFYQFLLSLGTAPMTLVLLAPCFAVFGYWKEDNNTIKTTQMVIRSCSHYEMPFYSFASSK